ASLGGPDLHVCLWTRGRDPDLGQCHAAVEGGQQSDSGFQTGKLLLVQIRLPTGVGVAVDSPTGVGGTVAAAAGVVQPDRGGVGEGEIGLCIGTTVRL